MPRDDVHVIPQDDRWGILEERENDAQSTHTTQDEAWQRGKELARERHTEALLHGADGQIRERNTHGEDPRVIKG